ncbi:hypothetical protein OED01_12065 [Microbacterium sp. M28]|uniref:hypothetical protein n=1 Tax=Microbacterium sp. M28 TaxID=2962064 RepID=UPI0021F3E2E5|nr:hypothetical protein [Microbacterium sp. M28]UYO96332.1 hypothetical protein OED01_12065 [Microbacterium sp. M28]
MAESVDDELRELREKAYGPGGELTAAEAERLEELQARARGTAPARAASTELEAGHHDEAPAQASRTIDPPAAGSTVFREPESLDEPEEGTDTEPADTRAASAGLRGISKRRWFPFAAVAVALLLGFGAGFAVFGQSVVRSIALSIAVGAEQAALEEAGDYDPGSITPIGQSHGATVWNATRQDGEMQCVVITRDTSEANGCHPTDQIEENGFWLGTSLDIPETEGSPAGSLDVSLVRDVDGDITMVSRFWTADRWDWRAQYTASELAYIDRIESETGIPGETLQIVGYDDETPIWLEYTGMGTCILVAVIDGVDRACTQYADEDVTLEIAGPDGTVTRYQVTVSSSRGPLLTIERVPAPGVDTGIDDRTGDVEP